MNGGTEQLSGIYSSSLVYLPAMLAQVTRLKRGKKEREEKQLVVWHTPNLAMSTHAHTRKDMQFWEEIPFAEETLQITLKVSSGGRKGAAKQGRSATPIYCYFSRRKDAGKRALNRLQPLKPLYSLAGPVTPESWTICSIHIFHSAAIKRVVGLVDFSLQHSS